MLCWMSGARADEGALASFTASIARMETAIANLKDATYVFHQTEVVKCKQQPAQEMEVKYRPPLDVYMSWRGNEHKGQQVLFRKGKEKGKLLVDPGPWIPSLWLDPKGNLATRGQRGNIHKMGFVALADIFRSDATLIETAAGGLDPTVTDLGKMAVHGQSAQCFRAEFPKDREPKLYASKVEVCFGVSSKLPISIKSWTTECGALRLVEEYSYADLKTNVGLTDMDFDPKNPVYGF